jgi:transcription antitermination factor NusG
MNADRNKENHLHEVEPRWFAIYTKYKREKLVQKRLHEQGIQTYLPLQHLTRRYERKVRVVELPLISCYVFTRITKKSYAPVLNTADVLRFVKFSQNLIAIPEREIQLLQRVVGGGVEVEIEPKSHCQVGDEVEIIGGGLAGVRGILVEKGKKKNVLLELKNIGCSLRMEVDPAMLRRVQFGSARAM